MPLAVKVELMTAGALGGATWSGASLHLSRCRRLWPAHEKDGAVCALESTSNAHVGDVGSRTTRRWHGYRAGLKARWSGAPVKLGGVERSHELRSGGGGGIRVWWVWATRACSVTVPFVARSKLLS